MGHPLGGLTRKSYTRPEWGYNSCRMRRLISIAAFGLLLAVPVWAQRGGGHGGGGHVGGGMHAGGFAGHAGGGHIGGARSFSGGHSGGMRPSPGFSRGFSHSSNQGFSHGSFHNHGFHGHHHNFNRFGFRNGWNWGWGSPWASGWGWYDPWVWSSWDDQDRRFDEDYYRQYEIANEWNRQNLEQQRMMRQEEADDDQDAYAPRSSDRRPAYDSASQPQEPALATVLVFRDQHKEEVSNYAIVGQTLWSFSGQRTKKIPLADLDIVATEKANDDRGVTFRAPVAAQGQ
jgi:hypothetical protein